MTLCQSNLNQMMVLLPTLVILRNSEAGDRGSSEKPPHRGSCLHPGLRLLWQQAQRPEQGETWKLYWTTSILIHHNPSFFTTLLFCLDTRLFSFHDSATVSCLSIRWDAEWDLTRATWRQMVHKGNYNQLITSNQHY